MNPLGRRSWRAPLRLLLLLGLFAPQDVTPAAAQQTMRECRCVDANGNTISDCTCFQTPNLERLRVFGAPRARIGVSLEESVDGARVTEVADESPAKTAGLLAGDVIVRVGTQSLREPLANSARERAIDDGGEVAVQRLMSLAIDWNVGTAIDLEILRAGERRTISVVPEEAPAQALAFGPGGRVQVFGDGRGLQLDSIMRGFRFDADSLRANARILGMRADSLGGAFTFRFSNNCMQGGRGLTMFSAACVDGVRLVELNPELGSYFGVMSGVLVSNVEDDSALGLRPGDVILSIGGRAVATPEEAHRILSSYGDADNVPLRVRRQNQDIDVSGRRR